MGNNAAVDSIIASLQELKASQSDTPVVKSSNPSEEMARFFSTLTDKVNNLQLATQPVVEEAPEEEVVEEVQTVQKTRKAAPKADAKEESDEEVTDDEDAEDASGRSRKKARKSMEKSEVEAVVNSAVAPINDSITKLTELMTVMAQAQMQNAQVPVAQSAAAPAPVVDTVVENAEVPETVEKTEDPIVAKVDLLTEQISALVAAISGQRVQNAETVVEEPVQAPVAKSQPEILPTVMHAQLPAYADNPAYAANAHNPAVLSNTAVNDPQNAVASVMKSMGFIPSSPVMRRNVLGLEEGANNNGTSTQNEDVELIKSADELSQMSFSQINRLRTLSGAW